MKYILGGNSHEMLADYIIDNGRKAMKGIDIRLDSIKTPDEWEKLRNELIKVYRNAYPEDMFSERTPVTSKLVSQYTFEKYRVENHLFESFPGWYVNATVYLPLERGIYPGVVCPTGHSSKTLPNYTGSAQLLARSGYIVISFDPPGMRGEHQGGNDHFEDGARGYLSGFWSQSFFIMDAIRCMDYLETREDVDKSKGFAMTGISGGGTTTIHTSVLDKRIACAAPVCCISDEEGVMFDDRYTFCPEGRGAGHIKGGIKYRTLLSLMAPIPCLIVNGRKDEVLNADLAAANVSKAARIYSLYGSDEMDLFIDENAGHEYTPDMVSEVAAFFDRYMKEGKKDGHYGYSYEDMEYPESSKVLCHPNDTSSMYTFNLGRFDSLEINRTNDAVELDSILNISKDIVPKAERLLCEPKKRWAHRIERKTYDIDEGRTIPGIYIEREANPSKRLMIFSDENGKWNLLENDGCLTKLTNFLDRIGKKEEFSVLSLDLSGFGELEMNPGEYDLSAWSRTERLISYIAIAMDTSILELRTEELLATMNLFNNTGRYDEIHAAGTGEAAMAVLLASHIFGRCEKVVLEGLPVSFRSIAEIVPNKFCPTSIIHDAPSRFELYEIVNQSGNITLVNPVYADGRIIPESEARKYYDDRVKLIYNENGINETILEEK